MAGDAATATARAEFAAHALMHGISRKRPPPLITGGMDAWTACLPLHCKIGSKWLRRSSVKRWACMGPGNLAISSAGVLPPQGQWVRGGAQYCLGRLWTLAQLGWVTAGVGAWC